MVKQNIQKISDNKECYGCSLCGDICHTSAINFLSDSEGFLYPQVDDDLCTNCTQCFKKCPVNNSDESMNFLKPDVYASWHKDEKVVQKSTSGGMFTAIAENIFSKNGVVYGAKFDSDMILKHGKAKNMEELASMRGSKYLQSDAEGIYKDMKTELKKGTEVLFVGLPCQTAAAKTYFKKYKNLFLVDIICHGINSPGVFQEYKKYIENKYNDNMHNFSFREKKTDWTNPQIEITFDTKKYNYNLSLDSYMAGYRKNLFVRECCFTCKYTKEQRAGDITIADFWGVPKEYYNKNGTSLALVNSEKGRNTFEEIKNNIIFFKSDIETAKQKNPQLSRPTLISEKHRLMRKEFFKQLNNGKRKKVFNTFIYGKPFPKLRKLRYKLLSIIKQIKYKLG